MENNEEQLNNIATSMATQAVMIAGAHTKYLFSEIQKASNIPQDTNIFNETFIYLAFFGLYVFRRKNMHLTSSGTVDRFDPILKNAFVSTMQLMGGLSSKDEVAMKKFLEDSYESLMRGYSGWRGDISIALKENLLSVFNRDDSMSKVKFWTEEQLSEIEKIVEKRSKSKLPWKKVSKERSKELIKELLHQRGIELVLPESVLVKFTEGISEEFEEMKLVTL